MPGGARFAAKCVAQKGHCSGFAGSVGRVWVGVFVVWGVIPKRTSFSRLPRGQAVEGKGGHASVVGTALGRWSAEYAFGEHE